MQTVRVGRTVVLLFILASAMSCMCPYYADAATWPSVADLKGDPEASYILSQGLVSYVSLNRHGQDKKTIRLGPEKVRVPKDWPSSVGGYAMTYSEGSTEVIFEKVKPGRYSLDSYGCSWRESDHVHSLDVLPANLSLAGATFDVPPGKVVYLGTLTLTRQANGFSYRAELIYDQDTVLELVDSVRPGLGKAAAPRVIRADYRSSFAVLSGAGSPVGFSGVSAQDLAAALRAADELRAEGFPDRVAVPAAAPETSTDQAGGKYTVTLEVKDGKLVATRIEPSKTVPAAAPETSTQQTGPTTQAGAGTSEAPGLPVSGRVLRTPEPPADAKLGDVWISPKDGAEMVYVPEGAFLMGSTDADIVAARRENPLVKGAFAEEMPQFTAHLPGYWIDKCEVTVAQYRRFCGATGRAMPGPPEWGWQEDHPMVRVTWDDAVAYAAWAGKQLPTEMEWEKAARGTDGRKYPWGNGWDDGKCANQSNSSTTKPVGSYPSGASPYGVLDMAGNVWEWCADLYDEEAYKHYARGEPVPLSSGISRAVRGGTWIFANPTGFRCAYRSGFDPSFRFSYYGFRCVRSTGREPGVPPE